MIFLSVLLVFVAILGDHLLKILTENVHKAIIDNSTHGLIGFISWLIVIIATKRKMSLSKRLLEAGLCGFVASIIDVDHFLYARSYRLEAAVHLGTNRPPLHSSSVPIMILFLLVTLSWKFELPNVGRFGWLIWVAVFSHHIRDGNRHGIWIWPVGSTPAIPYSLYLAFTVGVPYTAVYLMSDSVKNPFHLPPAANISIV